MYLNDYFTVPMSLAGIPAVSIPCGLSEGLPVGLQLAGPAFGENAILDAAHALERRSPSTARGCGHDVLRLRRGIASSCRLAPACEFASRTSRCANVAGGVPHEL